MRKPRLTTVKKSDFDLKCTLILANKKTSIDDKSRQILDLKNSISFPKRISKF